MNDTERFEHGVGPEPAFEVRYHSSDDMDELRWGGLMEPVAVVLRADGSVDVYGYVGVVDEREENGA